jgi:hypothetical protein
MWEGRLTPILCRVVLSEVEGPQGPISRYVVQSEKELSRTKLAGSLSTAIRSAKCGLDWRGERVVSPGFQLGRRGSCQAVRAPEAWFYMLGSHWILTAGI